MLLCSGDVCSVRVCNGSIDSRAPVITSSDCLWTHPLVSKRLCTHQLPAKIQNESAGCNHKLPDAVQTHWRKFIHWYTSCCDLIILCYSLVLSCLWCVLMMLCQRWRSIEANEVIPAPAPNRKIKHSSPFLLVLTMHMMSCFPHPVILLWKPIFFCQFWHFFSEWQV